MTETTLRAMFCQGCGAKLSEGATQCAACGRAVSAIGVTARVATQAMAVHARESSREAWKAFAVLAANPVGRLAPSFGLASSGSALSIGVVFGASFAACLAFGASRIGIGPFQLTQMAQFGQSAFKTFFQLFIVGAVFFAALTAASVMVKKIFRGDGPIAGDVFVAGAALLPLGLVFVAARLLGALNFEIVLALAAVGACVTVLMLHAGYLEVAKVPEPGATFGVPVAMLASMWIAKVVLVALLS